MKKIYLFAACLMAFNFNVVSQNNITPIRNCGTMEYDLQQKSLHPEIEDERIKIEEFTKQWISNNSSNKTSSAVVTIPVVVHVVYNTSTQNISDAQIQSQIAVLNADFSKLNSDFASVVPSEFSAVAADLGVQFCLATVDPNGNSTSGIVRVATTKTSFSTNDYVKYTSKGGDDAWPSGSYLNIWVCKISLGVIGYAQFPGGNASTDGVVIDYRYFGTEGTATAPYHLGRTTTHEVGHWLNLYHIWGDDNGSCSGSDNVSDTPNQSNYNFGCPTYPKSDNCSSSVMFMNFMDYTDDACMGMFSAGQSARAQALFSVGGARESLLSSLGCGVASSDTIVNDSIVNDTTVIPVSYCQSYSTNSSKNWIKALSFGSFVNSSGNNSGYGDFTSSVIDVSMGATYSLKLQPGFVNKSSMLYWTAWIDYNHDGDFDDAGESIGSGQTKNVLSLTVTIPSTAVVGTTRMRVSMKQGSCVSSSCDIFSGGEVEDYTINLLSPAIKMGSFDETPIVNLYPNPAKNSVVVSLNSSIEVDDSVILKIVDLQGRAYQLKSLSGSGLINQEFDLTDIPAGIYFISVQSSQFNTSKKLIVSK